MYGNYNPKEEWRPEDNPHTPTNFPEEVKEKAYRIFEHVESWSSHSGHVKYAYPKVEEGYNDYELMLDTMGFEVGEIFEFRDGTKLFVVDRFPVYVKWGDKFKLDRGGVSVYRFGDSGWGEKIDYTPGEGYNPKDLWKSYIYDDLYHVASMKDI